jgi:prepilin-type N-terminal cleavage/methylation domain-containing protein
MRARQAGFSLVELMMVLVIIVIISTIAIPQIARINANYKLDASGHAVASLIQQSRLQAVKSNLPAYVQYDATQSPNIAFVNADPKQAYAAGNPDVALAANVVFQNALLPNHAQLDTYLGGNGVTIEPMTNNIQSIAFNARGLPCVPSGNPQVCNPTDGGALPAFLWLMKNTASGGWEAVTVTPAGRVKAWRLANSSAGATAACGFAACWQ